MYTDTQCYTPADLYVGHPHEGQQALALFVVLASDLDCALAVLFKRLLVTSLGEGALNVGTTKLHDNGGCVFMSPGEPLLAQPLPPRGAQHGEQALDS